MDLSYEIANAIRNFDKCDEEDSELEYDEISIKAVDITTNVNILSSSKNDSDEPESDGGNSSFAPTLVFVNSAVSAEELAAALLDRNIVCGQFHKLMKLSERIETLSKFKNGEIFVLVATDHASRYEPDVFMILTSLTSIYAEV